MAINIINTLEEIISKENCNITELARRMGINHKQIRMYLEGSLPRLKTAIKIANFYNCSLDYLFNLTNEYIPLKKQLELDYDNFYSKYNNLLEQNNISHFALSKKINICETSLSPWKKGAMPETYAVIEIAIYFGVSIDYLICK